MRDDISNEEVERILRGRGFTTDEHNRWRLPHSLYSLNKFEYQLIEFLYHNKFNDHPFSDEAIRELEFQLVKPWQCKIGWHTWGLWIIEYGPQTAIQMNQRSGAIVTIYSGEWRTCLRCGKQQIRGGVPKN
jgi:hypothetical protein